jgi:hypothetical protein
MFLTFNLYSQTKEGFYVTNSLDTVKCKIELPTYNGKLDFYAFYGSVKVDIDGVKKKYKPKKIQSFTVYNIDSVNYKFMSFETERYFVNVLVEGGLTLCKVYNPHPYDHSPGFVYALIKNNKIKHLNLFNTHGAVGKLISDYPGLYKDWAVDKKYSTSDLVEVVKAYNAYTSHQ